VLRIGVVSDTHLDGPAPVLPPGLAEALKGVSRILHAGDVIAPAVLDELAAIAPVEAVCGNMDGAEIRARLPEKRIVEVGGFRIGLIHGRFGGAETARYAFDQFRTSGVAAVAFGHTHEPFYEVCSGVLLFNPGSAAGRMPARFASVGVLELGREIAGRIVRL
jgi:hypothetical protein